MWFSKRDSPVLPLPFSVRPSNLFEGNDGLWSTFLLQVGSPAQTFRAVVSTSSFSTWLPNSEGCKYAQDPSFVPNNCTKLRGIGLYQGFQSSGFQESNGSFKYIGANSLEIGNDLDTSSAFGPSYDMTGDLGLDSVTLLDSVGSAMLSPAYSVPVYGLSNWNFFLPSLGLGDGNIQSTTQNTPSFLESLANLSIIPSRSWGYTAGASYRDDYLASLVLGGYDESRLEPNSTTYYSLPPSSGTSKLQVSVSSIALSYNNGSEASVPIQVSAVIDSTLPYLYLPMDVCESLASKLGLRYDGDTELYTIDDQSLASNKAAISQIRITVGDTVMSGNTTSIIFPYSAFDLSASWPTYDQNASKSYFPIRRAASKTYILGRSFLQEAYISVDHERAYFNLSSAAFPTTRTSPKLVPIYNISTTTTDQHPNNPKFGSPHNLSVGAIAGIAVAATILSLLAIALLLWFCFYNKRRARSSPAESIILESKKMMPDRQSSTSSQIIPPLSATTRSDRDPISPIDGQFYHITPISELGTSTAQESRTGVNVLPGIHEVGEKPDPALVFEDERPTNHTVMPNMRRYELE